MEKDYCKKHLQLY